jgi:hypothetical protein
MHGIGAAILVATLTVAPAVAMADDCVSGRVAWAGAAPVNTTRTVVAQFVDVLDAGHWVGYANVTLSYVPAHTFKGHVTPAQLNGGGSELFSTRTFCRDTGGGFCLDNNPFDMFAKDPIDIALFTSGGMYYYDSTSGVVKEPSTYQCLNNNTVAYTVGDRTFVLALSNQEVTTQPPQ